MDDSKGSGAGLAVLALVVCCAAPLLIAAGVLGVIGAWLRNVTVLVVAGVVVTAAVLYTLRRRRRGAACAPARSDSRTRDGEQT